MTWKNFCKNVHKEITKPMTWQSVVLFCVTMIIMVTIILCFVVPPVNVEGKCEVKGINYKNVCPDKCWSETISCRFCPLPTDISCEGKAKAPMIKMMEMFQ